MTPTLTPVPAASADGKLIYPDEAERGEYVIVATSDLRIWLTNRHVDGPDIQEWLKAHDFFPDYRAVRRTEPSDAADVFTTELGDSELDALVAVSYLLSNLPSDARARVAGYAHQRWGGVGTLYIPSVVSNELPGS
jgi:hypothetical protein